jgi:NhaP-type Na+/H+ or K+/H+ antiporter
VLVVFVTLGINLSFNALQEYLLGGLLVMAVFIFIARPITVLACLLPDRRGEWARNEIAFLSWCRYTGVIPAAVASILLAEGVERAEIAVSLVALAVCTMLLLQATTAGYVARRLSLIDELDEEYSATGGAHLCSLISLVNKARKRAGSDPDHYPTNSCPRSLQCSLLPPRRSRRLSPLDSSS